MARIKKVLRTLNPADILTKYIARNCCTAMFQLLGLRCGHPLWLCGFAHHFSQKNPNEKEELRESCSADMCLFMCTCHDTCACAVRHVFDFRSSRNLFAFLHSPNRNDETFAVKLLLVRCMTFPVTILRCASTTFQVHMNSHPTFRSGCSFFCRGFSF